ncbi:MAG: hypothetical protein IMZ61_07795, partial [Planctomycetes bacterium]|nr:hypothetical protein [Planctomycetota bacterium]
TTVKSYITGTINPKDKANAFQEDREANEKIFGNSVYCTLDGIHHDIAFALDELPSGMMTMHGNGKVHEMKSKGTHPIVRRIKYEHCQIKKDAEKRRWDVHNQTRKVNL